jgi:hypothetical protein
MFEGWEGVLRLREAVLPASLGFSRIRRSAGIIAAASVMIFWTVAALAADAPDWLADDVALTKATVSLLAAKDVAAVRERLDPAAGPVSDTTLLQMAGVVGATEPVSIETISERASHNIQTGDGNSRLILEYTLPDKKWVVVDAAVKTQGGAKHLTRLFVTANALPLREGNAFHLLGKGVMQYLFLASWLAVIGITLWAMVVAFRRHNGWRRWALMAAMPLGLTPTVAMNWNTAQVWVLEAVNNAAGSVIPIFAFRYPMALYGRTETLVPYLYISAPLIAFGYLIWAWRRPRTPEAITAPTD